MKTSGGGFFYECLGWGGVKISKEVKIGCQLSLSHGKQIPKEYVW